jgi:hypothetical protein
VNTTVVLLNGLVNESAGSAPSWQSVTPGTGCVPYQAPGSSSALNLPLIIGCAVGGTAAVALIVVNVLFVLGFIPQLNKLK